MVYKSDFFILFGLIYSKLFKRKMKGNKLSLVTEELTRKIYEEDRYEVLKYNSATAYQVSSPDLQKQKEKTSPIGLQDP